jgi:hypothetical protein
MKPCNKKMLHYRHLKQYQCPKYDYQGKCGLHATSYIPSTDMRCLMMGIRSEKCVVRRFRHCANVIQCTYTNLDIIDYNTPSLYIAYCSLFYKPVEHVTVLNNIGNCNTMVSIIILWVSRRDIQNRHCRWLNNQHSASWRGLGNTLRQARELISGPSLGNKAKFLSFTRTQARVVTGLLTGHNTLRRHLFLLHLANSPACRGCGVKEETSAHVLCECEAWVSLRHTHLGSFFLEPEDIKSIGLGAICGLVKPQGSHDMIRSTKGPY